MIIQIDHTKIDPTRGSINITVGAGELWQQNRRFDYAPGEASFTEAQLAATYFHAGACAMFETMKEQMSLRGSKTRDLAQLSPD